MKKGKGSKKYLKEAEWNVLSPEAQSKIIESCKKGKDFDKEDTFLVSNKSAKTIKSLSKRMKLLEKDNPWLKKLVSMLQKCNEDLVIHSVGLKPFPRCHGNAQRTPP